MPMKKSTRVNHPPVVALPPDNHAVVAPIYQSVKFEFESLEETERYLRGERPGFFYTRSSKIADIGAITRAARAVGSLTVLDNTFAGFHQHGDSDVDVFVHSLTKYASGAGDVMGGAVIARAELISALRADFGALGGTLDPHAAFLILRGLRTYFVRYEAQCARALRIAQLLAGHPAVARVHYPGLPTHPQHALAARQMRDFGTIVTFDLRGGEAAARRFADTLELFALTPSLGSGDSLILTAQIMSGRELDPGQQRISAITPGTVRLSIGLEDLDDLIEDVVRGLAAAGP